MASPRSWRKIAITLIDLVFRSSDSEDLLRSDLLQSEKARSIVVEDIPLLFGSQELGGIDALDGNADSLWPKHLIGAKHYPLAKSSLNQAT
jgi:hypothetical protein